MPYLWASCGKLAKANSLAIAKTRGFIAAITNGITLWPRILRAALLFPPRRTLGTAWKCKTQNLLDFTECQCEFQQFLLQQVFAKRVVAIQILKSSRRESWMPHGQMAAIRICVQYEDV